MTIDEFYEEFEHELYKAFGQSKILSPYKTGNLRNNGLKIIRIDDQHYKITVDLNAAPYAKWLDDKAKVQREHPEGWFNEIALTIVQKIIRKYSKGILTSDLESSEAAKVVSTKSPLKTFSEFRNNNY